MTCSQSSLPPRLPPDHFLAQRYAHMVGQTYEQLTVTYVIEVMTSRGRRIAKVVCKCSCGGYAITPPSRLLNHHTKSCGCRRHDGNGGSPPTHGMTKTPTYYAWASIWQMHKRGVVTIDSSWRDFEQFLADMGIKPDGLTLSRIDSNAGYSKTNCKWATRKEHARNSKTTVFITYRGETKTMTEWSAVTGIDYYVIQSRRSAGWSTEDIFEIPVGADTGRNLVHGMSYTPTHHVWTSMKARCNNPKNLGYKRYGARGITYDPAWESFTNFFNDMGECPPGLTLERLDNNAGYSKANCAWVTPTQQARNRRTTVFITYRGVTKCAPAWAEITGISTVSLTNRVRKGWTPEDTLEIVVTNGGQKRRFSPVRRPVPGFAPPPSPC